MKISVITVCFNAETTIGHTIESFLRQSHPAKELIIVDGASQDGTMDVVESFPRTNIVASSEPDRGIYDAMNKGFDLYRGDAVGFLNADDRFCDEHALADIADGLADADMLSANLDFVRDHQSSVVVRHWCGTAYKAGGFRHGWMPAHPTFYARREVIDAVGRFDLRYRIAADYDYMLRAYELQGFTSRYLDRTLVNMMAGGSSTAGITAYVRSNLESLDARRRWLGSGIIDFALFAKPLRKLSQFAVR